MKSLIDTLGDVSFLNMEGTIDQSSVPVGARLNQCLVVCPTKKNRITLIIEAAKNGQPSPVRNAINQLYRYTSGRSDVYGIVAAPYIAPATVRICQEEGVGYLDLAGNCRLIFDTVYLVRDGVRNPFVQKRDLRSLYSPRGTKVLRIMLSSPKVSWRMQRLAERASVSLGQVANIKKLLKDREWIIEGDEGFRLREPAQLLAEWSEKYSFRKSEVREFYGMSDMPAIESALADQCARRGIAFALTGLGGAARVQPGTRYQRIMAYASELPIALVEETGLKEVTSGANVTLLIPYDNGVFDGSQSYDGMPVVSPVQLYLDLKSYKGRGEEAAQTIYDNLLSSSW